MENIGVINCFWTVPLYSRRHILRPYKHTTMLKFLVLGFLITELASMCSAGVVMGVQVVGILKCRNAEPGDLAKSVELWETDAWPDQSEMMVQFGEADNDGKFAVAGKVDRNVGAHFFLKIFHQCTSDAKV